MCCPLVPDRRLGDPPAIRPVEFATPRTSRSTLQRRLPAIAVAAAVLVLTCPALGFTEAEKEAMTEFQPSDGPMVLEWLTVAGIIAGGLAAALLTILVISYRAYAHRAATAGGPAAELPTPLCILLTGAIVTGGMTLAAVMAAFTVSGGMRRAVAESGPIEGLQLGLWVLSVVMALAAARFLPAREARRALLLLGLGALLAAARELDVHLMIHPRNLGDWGTAFRINWWFKSTTPLLPRLVWGTAGLIILAAGLYVVRWGAPALLGPGRRLRRLLPALAAVAALFFVSFSIDDLLRFRVRLHPARVIEETVELAAVLIFVGCVIWAIQTSWRESDHGRNQRMKDEG